MRIYTALAIVAAVSWALLVAWSPPWFFLLAAPFCAVWMALATAGSPSGLRAPARPRPFDVAVGVGTGLLLYAASRVFLWAGCGGFTVALCAPLAEMFARFHTRALLPALTLGFLVAPAEEVFWRGFVQAHLARRLGHARGIVLATLLAVGLALVTGEPFLALATLPTYAVWGVLATWRGSLVPAIVSHATWSVLVASVAPPA